MGHGVGKNLKPIKMTSLVLLMLQQNKSKFDNYSASFI